MGSETDDPYINPFTGLQAGVHLPSQTFLERYAGESTILTVQDEQYEVSVERIEG